MNWMRCQWDDELLEMFEERAAILQFEGGLDREEAVKQAAPVIHSLHLVRQEAKLQALAIRPREEIEAEYRAQREAVAKENAEYNEVAKQVWPDSARRRRKRY